MKLLKIAAAMLCVCFLFTAAYAANAGGQGDPLVTLSYLSGTYTQQVKTMVDQAVTARRTEMEQSLKNILAGNGGTITTPSGGNSVFTVVTLTQGQSLVGDVGCEVMLRIGAAVCGAEDSVGLIDTTSGQALAVNHLYMVTISPRRVTATSGTVKVLARGPYSIQ